MGRVDMRKIIVSIFVVGWFFISALTPLVLGLNSGFSKASYYREHLLGEYGGDSVESDELALSVESSPKLILGGPMDSAWPMLCHDNHHTGLSPYSAENACAEKWRFFNGYHGIDSSPVVGNDGTIYFGNNYGELLAVYPNGTLRWRTEVWGGMPIWSTPVIAEDGTIYVNSYSDALFAVNPNGTVKWHHGGAGSVSSPAIDGDGTVYYGNFEGYVFAVCPNGTRKWFYKTGDAVCSSPAISDDGIIYIGSFDTYLYALYPNGSLCWRFKTGDPVKGPPSIDDDGTIYAGSYDGYLYALYSDGSMKWRCHVGYGTETNPSIAADGIIYVGGDKLYAIYPNGTIKWSFYLGPDRDIDKSSPAISADGTIFVGVTHGGVVGGEIVAVSPEGNEKWRKLICPNEWCDVSPAIVENETVYITAGYNEEISPGIWKPVGYLLAFGIGNLEPDANGPYFALKNESIQFKGEALGGYLPYSYHWDFGDGYTSDEQNPTHIYTNKGNYTVIFTVTDNTNNQSSDFTWAWIQETNTPPDKPTIDGPRIIKIESEYKFKFMATDSDGSVIWYYIDWGGFYTGWIGPYNSGKQTIVANTWGGEHLIGLYVIKCKAKDPYGAESDWSDPFLVIVIPPINSQNNPQVNPSSNIQNSQPGSTTTQPSTQPSSQPGSTIHSYFAGSTKLIGKQQSDKNTVN